MHKKHASALEKALRCLDNDAIASEEIDPLRDDLDYYLVRQRGRERGAGGGVAGAWWLGRGVWRCGAVAWHGSLS